MAKFNGTEWKMYVQESGVKTAIGSLRSNTFNVAGETIDVSTKDSLGWKEFLAGWRSVSCDCAGVVDFQQAGVKDATELFEYLEDRTMLTLINSNGVVGDQEFEMKGFLTNMSLTAEAESACEFSCTFQGSGKPTRRTIS